jgi:hypothetical protein
MKIDQLSKSRRPIHTQMTSRAGDGAVYWYCDGCTMSCHPNCTPLPLDLVLVD